MTAPRYLHFQLTERCNLACPGCYLPERVGPGGDVEDIEKTVFKPAAEAGVRFATLTGGEPLLHPDWAGVCAAAVEHFDTVQLVCNGMLLDLDAYDVLREIGVREIKVSLDGPTAEVHDVLRGKTGCFDAVTANLRAISALSPERRGEIDLGCICTIHPENVAHLHATALLVDEMGLDSILFQPFHPYDLLYPETDVSIRHPGQDESFMAALREQLDLLRALRRERPGFLDNSLAMLDRFEEFYTAPAGPKQSCGADRFLFVNSAFEVRGCLFCAPLGSMRQQGPADFRRSSAWRGFDQFRSGCTRCLMGCQFVEAAQDLTEAGFRLLDDKAYGDARQTFEQALSVEYLVGADHGLGLCLFHLDRLDEARKRLERASAHRPRNLFIMGDLAQVLSRMKDVAALEGLLDRIFSLTTEHAFGNRFRGQTLRERGERSHALPYLKKGMELSPGDDPWPAFEYGLACLELEDFDEAAHCIEKAVQLDPEFPWFRYRLAMAFSGLDKKNDALKSCREAIELDNGPEQFHQLLAELED